MGEGFQKSAIDRAMERADQIQVSEAKLKEMEYHTEGEKIAAALLKDEGYNLEEALKGFDKGGRKQVSKAVESVLLQNLSLKRGVGLAGNEQIIQRLSMLKKNKSVLNQAKAQLENLSNYYTQTRQQNYDRLKSQFEQAMNQAVQQKTGLGGLKFNVEQSSEFQEKWRQVSRQVDAEYEKALAQLKQQLAEID